MSVKTLADAPRRRRPSREDPVPEVLPGQQRRGAPHTGLIAVLIAVIVATFAGPTSFATDTNANVINIPASGQRRRRPGRPDLTLLMTAGGMDFSMGSNVAVTTAVGAQLLAHGHSTAFAVVACLVLATLIGLVNGAVVTFTNVALAFVATLATATSWTASPCWSSTASASPSGPEMFALGNNKILGVPYLLVVAILVLVATRPWSCGSRCSAATPSRSAATSTSPA
ncbi:hypothetical protein ACRAWF_21305 [Streptomyces sp. L7]